MLEPVRDMSEFDVPICEFCRRGRLAQRAEEITFYQRTDKGYVFCRATIPVSVCGQCHAKTWDEAAEELIARAVAKEYDKLP